MHYTKVMDDFTPELTWDTKLGKPLLKLLLGFFVFACFTAFPFGEILLIVWWAIIYESTKEVLVRDSNIVIRSSIFCPFDYIGKSSIPLKEIIEVDQGYLLSYSTRLFRGRLHTEEVIFFHDQTKKPIAFYLKCYETNTLRDFFQSIHRHYPHIRFSEQLKKEYLS